MHAMNKRTKFVVLCECRQNEYETITRSLEATTADALSNFRFSLETLMRFDSTMSPRQVKFTQESAESLPIRCDCTAFSQTSDAIFIRSFVRTYTHAHICSLPISFFFYCSHISYDTISRFLFNVGPRKKYITKYQHKPTPTFTENYIALQRIFPFIRVSKTGNIIDEMQVIFIFQLNLLILLTLM